MKNIIVLLITLLITINIGSALDCQYTELETYEENVEYFYHNDEFIGENLNLSELVRVEMGYTIRVVNNLEVPIDLEIQYNRYSYGFGVNEDKTIFIHVEGKDFETYADGFSSTYGCGSVTGCKVTLIKYKFIKPNIISSETSLVSKQQEVCKQCTGVDCLNDGSACSFSRECGGGFCIEGRCSNSETCYDNNCNCASHEIECPDKTRCVEKGIIPLDVAPKCGLVEECVSGFINQESELCAKSPTQLQNEQNELLRQAQEEEIERQRLQQEQEEKTMKIIILLVSIILIGIIVIVFMGFKIEEKRQKRLQEETNLETARLAKAHIDLEKIKEKIIFYSLREKNKENELKKLSELKEQKKKQLTEIENIERDINEKWNNLKPFPDSQAKNRLVVINPYLGGYKCFSNKELELKEYPKSSLVHIWVWKKQHGRWPKPGHHIHHIDHDKYNNSPENLKEIDGEEHFALHRKQ